MEHIKKTRSGLKLVAGASYASHVCGKVLAKMKDTGNGFIFKIPSYGSTVQDNYICLDYAEADYIRQLLNQYEETQNGT
jgi:hypothetical protein